MPNLWPLLTGGRCSEIALCYINLNWGSKMVVAVRRSLTQVRLSLNFAQKLSMIGNYSKFEFTVSFFNYLFLCCLILLLTTFRERYVCSEFSYKELSAKTSQNIRNTKQFIFMVLKCFSLTVPYLIWFFT